MYKTQRVQCPLMWGCSLVVVRRCVHERCIQLTRFVFFSPLQQRSLPPESVPLKGFPLFFYFFFKMCGKGGSIYHSGNGCSEGGGFL